MAHVTLQANWQFQADSVDASLILKALGGRLTEEEKQDAKELGDELTLQRAAQARMFADQMSSHAAKVKP